MSEENGKTTTLEEPFNGKGPQNLSPQMLQQAWSMTALLAYERRVRVLTEQLRKCQEDIEREL